MMWQRTRWPRWVGLAQVEDGTWVAGWFLPACLSYTVYAVPVCLPLILCVSAMCPMCAAVLATTATTAAALKLHPPPAHPLTQLLQPAKGKGNAGGKKKAAAKGAWVGGVAKTLNGDKFYSKAKVRRAARRMDSG